MIRYLNCLHIAWSGEASLELGNGAIPKCQDLASCLLLTAPVNSLSVWRVSNSQGCMEMGVSTHYRVTEQAELEGPHKDH